MRKSRVIAAAVAAAFVLCWIQPGAAGAQPNFDPKDTKTTQTVGMAVFWVHPQYRTLVEHLPGWNPKTKRWTIPYMQDLHSRVANSDQHRDDSASDLNGTLVGIDNTLVSDSDFIAWPASGYVEGPRGTKEVHTEIRKLRMEDPSKKFVLRAGPGAGVTDPDKKSVGEVEARNPGSVFPAESFFNVFVEVDTPFGVGSGVLYNKAPLVVVADNLRSLPPRVVYTHSGTSEAVPVFFKDHHGAPFGHLLIAGHGVNVEEEELNEKMKKEKPLPCPRCKAKGPQRPGEAEDVDPEGGPN